MQQVANTAGKAAAGAEGRLTLGEILDWLLEDKLVEAEPVDKLKKERRYYRGTTHPLVIIADQKWKSKNAPGTPALTLDFLTEWLAKRVAWNTCTSIR